MRLFVFVGVGWILFASNVGVAAIAIDDGRYLGGACSVVTSLIVLSGLWRIHRRSR